MTIPGPNSMKTNAVPASVKKITPATAGVIRVVCIIGKTKSNKIQNEMRLL